METSRFSIPEGAFMTKEEALALDLIDPIPARINSVASDRAALLHFKKEERTKFDDALTRFCDAAAASKELVAEALSRGYSVEAIAAFTWETLKIHDEQAGRSE